MSYQVLARKWRPTTFKDVIGQEHITRSLANAILRKKIGHAYLLSGTRGIGKTSVARIFAKALRCNNVLEDGNACGTCSSCLEFNTGNSLNVHEIDGASNNSVDNIRDLIGEVHFLPTSGKYRIYIIDEVHMLSTAAFNVLLKTLEEPPEHVIFIFATTDPGKLLGTVLSRCQRFDFKMATQADLVNHVKKIASAEGIEFESIDSIEQICREGRGSVRDTLTLLDQVLSFAGDKLVTEEILVTSLGLARTTAVRGLMYALLNGDVKDCSSKYRGLLNENIPLKNIVYALLDQVFELIERGNFNEYSRPELFWIYETLSKDSQWGLTSLSPEKVMEIVLQKLALRKTFFTDKVEKTESAVKKKTWESFLAHLIKKSPATASNLEQGNLIKPIELGEDGLIVYFGFPPSSKVFYEYLQDDEIKANLVNFLKIYFAVSNIKFETRLEQGKFKSKADIRQQKTDEVIDAKKQEILNTPIIKEAEAIFNTKVDKVFIRE
ncbi:MAG: DNA polymerase III subunit gamma/tau [Epsilonproteobacteria bacterium]|nr:MAG: DNA polymerase III subunit gamma/tau [Campylobacterota bacterium]RLA66849.1 MAG: DNA polymerase III subunit gamma/tau [Campylobacterota bacterium]